MRNKTLLLLFLLLFFTSFESFADQLITPQLIAKADAKYKTFAKNRFLSVQKDLLEALKNQSDMRKLIEVNNWYNFIRYASDKQVYHVNDYWATLYEFVGKGMGDCEDYTIAKYYTLKALGIDPRRMKFTYVIYKDRFGKRIPHMVLAYLKVPKPKSKNDILILDNTNSRVLPASKRTNIVKVIKMINGDTGPKSKKWKLLEINMKRKKL